LETEDWKNDLELRKLPTLDILLAFEDYSRVKEREFEEQSRRSQVEKTRRERKGREAFKVKKFPSCPHLLPNLWDGLGPTQRFGGIW